MTTDETRADRLLAPWARPYGEVPPFDSADPAAIEIAYRRGVAMMQAEVAAIAAQSAAPDFDNTIAALEDAGRALARVETLFRVFCSSALSDDMNAVQQRLAPLRPALDDAIAHNDALFARIVAVRSMPGLTAVERRLVDGIHRRMVRRGALLGDEGRARLAEINQALATLHARFAQHVQADVDQHFVAIDDPAELAAGLSEPTIAVLAREAHRRGIGGHAVANQRGLFDTIMSTASSRTLRERGLADVDGAGGAATNPPLADAILTLRGEKARLLGFATYADYATGDRMAGTPGRALALCERISAAAVAQADEHGRRVAACAAEAGWNGPIEAWDRAYWTAQIAAGEPGSIRRRYAYLPLAAMLEAAFWAAGQLYGLSFHAIDALPVLDPDIRVYEVRRGGACIGLLYADLFTRPGKRGTAWMDEYRTAERFRGRVLPIASLNHCLSPPGSGQTVLLSWDSAQVLFHEMGHALHALLTEVDYPSLGIMNVAWDMIELPSQLFETLIATPEALTRFARHYRTDAPLPDRWIARLTASTRPDPGGWALAQAASAIVDLRLHLAADGGSVDAQRIAADTLAAIPMPNGVDPRHLVPHFMHIFAADAYAAGYYSYHWADVMVADATDCFSARGGPFDPATARRFRDAVMSVGSSVPAEQAYRAFAGRESEPQALIRKLGLAA